MEAKPVKNASSRGHSELETGLLLRNLTFDDDDDDDDDNDDDDDDDEDDDDDDDGSDGDGNENIKNANGELAYRLGSYMYM